MWQGPAPKRKPLTRGVSFVHDKDRHPTLRPQASSLAIFPRNCTLSSSRAGARTFTARPRSSAGADDALDEPLRVVHTRSHVQLASVRAPLSRPADRPLPAHHGLRLLEAGAAEREAVFHLLFRRHPFEGGYSVACGLRYAIDYLRGLRFAATISRISRPSPATTASRSSTPASSTTSRAALGAATSTPSPKAPSSSRTSRSCACTGPIFQCQLLETALLN